MSITGLQGRNCPPLKPVFHILSDVHPSLGLEKIFSFTLKLETAATVKLFRWLNSEGSASKPHEAGFPGAVTAESSPLRDDWVLVGLCYPSDSTFQIMADINDRQSNTFDDITDYGAVSSLAELEKRPMDRKYFFDQAVG